MIQTIAIGIVAAAVALAMLGGTVAAFLHVLKATPTPEHPQPSPDVAELKSELAALSVKVDALPSLWELERERAEKARSSAAALKRRAEELARASERGGEEDEEDEDWDDILPLFDGEGSEGSGVQPMSEGLGGAPTPDMVARANALINGGF